VTVRIPESAYSYYLCEGQLARAPTGFVSQGAIYGHNSGRWMVDPKMNIFTDCSRSSASVRSRSLASSRSSTDRMRPIPG
jgi:hypothetical protein